MSAGGQKDEWLYVGSVEAVAVQPDFFAEVRRKGQPLGRDANKAKGERFKRAIVRLAKAERDRRPKSKTFYPYSGVAFGARLSERFRSAAGPGF